MVAQKASSSLVNLEAEIIRKWLKKVIGDLDLPSLQSFPTRELSLAFPQLISSIAQSIKEPSGEIISNRGIKDLATCMATIHKEEPVAAKVFNDYAALKQLLVEAASTNLRYSDTEALKVFQRLDDGFMSLFRIGIEAFVEQHSAQLMHMANTDGLTGLYNIRYFRKQLHENLEMYKRYEMPFSLVMIDLDKLKELNDVRGHTAGDQALKHLAKIMINEKRETDVAVRYGGDEFFLLLPGTLTEKAESLAHRISDRVKQINLSSGGREMTSVSLGVVACPLNGIEGETLLAKADQALYLAKTFGGGAVARYREFNIESHSDV